MIGIKDSPSNVATCVVKGKEDRLVREIVLGQWEPDYPSAGRVGDTDLEGQDGRPNATSLGAP